MVPTAVEKGPAQVATLIFEIFLRIHCPTLAEPPSLILPPTDPEYDDSTLAGRSRRLKRLVSETAERPENGFSPTAGQCHTESRTPCV